jgi:hypothetical protein
MRAGQMRDRAYPSIMIDGYRAGSASMALPGDVVGEYVHHAHVGCSPSAIRRKMLAASRC